MSIIDFFSNLFGSHIEDLTNNLPDVGGIVDGAQQAGEEVVTAATDTVRGVADAIPGQIDDQVIDQITENLPGKQ